jgi:transposase
MPRLMLNDTYWAKLKPILLQLGVHDKPHLRRTVDGILFRMRTGVPWRDLPREFGHWNAVYKRFNYWSNSDILMKSFKELSKDTDTEWEFIDGSYIKAHQHSAGAMGEGDQAIGLSRGGNTTKIHLAVDSYGLPIVFEVTGGDVHDSKAAPSLIDQLPEATAIVCDKGYDSQGIRDQITAKGAVPVIPRRKNSKVGNADLDKSLYKLRHLVENAFCNLKKFRAIATRYDKLKRNFVSMVALACCFLWLPM